MIFRRTRPRFPGDIYRRRLIALTQPPAINAMVDVTLADLTLAASGSVRLPLQNVFGGVLPSGYRRRRRRRPVAASADARIAPVAAVAAGKVRRLPLALVWPPRHGRSFARVGNIVCAAVAVRGFSDAEVELVGKMSDLIGRGASRDNLAEVERLVGRPLTDEEVEIAAALLYEARCQVFEGRVPLG